MRDAIRWRGRRRLAALAMAAAAAALAGVLIPTFAVPARAATGPGGPLDGRAVATAALSPMWRVLNVGRDVARFILVEVKPRVDSGAVRSADSSFRIAGRDGSYSVQWYDADGDRTLSRGDGLDLQFSGCSPGQEPDWDGVVRTPDLSLVQSNLSLPYFYADVRLRGAAGTANGDQIDDRERMVGSLSVTWSTSAAGEKLSAYQGASGFSFGAGSALDASATGTFLRRIRIAFSCPQRGDFEARLEGEIYDRRFGHLTLIAVQPFKGPCEGTPGAAATGQSTVLREQGGSVAIRMTGPGMAVLEVDENGDGDVDRRLDTNWAALTGRR